MRGTRSGLKSNAHIMAATIRYSVALEDGSHSPHI